MSSQGSPTRRSFLKAGALAAPLVAAPAAVMAEDGLKARLARLEDEAALRALHREWLAQVNASEPRWRDDVRSIAPDHAAADSIEIDPDGRIATGRFPCLVETQNVLAPDCTLTQMAHAQGGGCVCDRERRTLVAAYAKTGDAWTIVKFNFAA